MKHILIVCLVFALFYLLYAVYTGFKNGVKDLKSILSAPFDFARGATGNAADVINPDGTTNIPGAIGWGFSNAWLPGIF